MYVTEGMKGIAIAAGATVAVGTIVAFGIAALSKKWHTKTSPVTPN